MPNPVEEAFPTSGTGDRGDIKNLLQMRYIFVVANLAELQGNEFTGHQYIFVKSQNRLYGFDGAEVGGDDGVDIIVDNAGNRFKRVIPTDPVELPKFTVATVATALQKQGGMAFITDEVNGPCAAVFDGADWLRVYDNVIIS